MDKDLNRERSFSRRAILWGVSALLVALAAEGWVRLDDHERYGTPWRHTPDFTADLTVHDSLGVRGRPSGVHKAWRLNSAGFRSPEDVLVARPGCPAVAVLGASETFGYEERAGKEYPAQLADSLSTRGCYRVINAGITGATLPASHQLWVNWVRRFAPEVVLIYVNPLQFLGESAPVAPKPQMTPRVDERSIRPRLVDRAKDVVVFPEFVQRRRLVRMVDALEKGRDSSWFLPRVPDDRLRRFVTEVDSIVTSISESGAQPVLVFHAVRDTLLVSDRARYGFEALRQFGARARSETMVAFDSAAQAELTNLSGRRNVPIVNLRPLLSGSGENFVDAVHFTELGASRVAHHLAGAVERLRQK